MTATPKEAGASIPPSASEVALQRDVSVPGRVEIQKMFATDPSDNSEAGKMTPGLHEASRTSQRRVNVNFTQIDGHLYPTVDAGVHPPSAQVRPAGPARHRAFSDWVPVAVRGGDSVPVSKNDNTPEEKKPPIVRFTAAHPDDASVDIEFRAVAGRDLALEALEEQETAITNQSHAKSNSRASQTAGIAQAAFEELNNLGNEGAGVFMGSIAVGGPDPVSARRARDEFIKAAAGVGNVVLVPGEGRYDTPEEAHEHAPRPDPKDHVPLYTTPKAAGDLTELPTDRRQELPNVPLVDRDESSPNVAEFPPGTATLKLGEVVMATPQGDVVTGDFEIDFRNVQVEFLGGTGSGKTTALQAYLVGATIANERDNQAHPERPPITQVAVYVDLAKEYDSYRLANQLAAKEVPHSGRVVEINPGSTDGNSPYYGIGLLRRIPGISPGQFANGVTDTFTLGYVAADQGKGGDANRAVESIRSVVNETLFGSPGHPGLISKEDLYADNGKVFHFQVDQIVARATESMTRHAKNPQFQGGNWTGDFVNWMSQKLSSYQIGPSGDYLTADHTFDLVAFFRKQMASKPEDREALVIRMGPEVPDSEKAFLLAGTFVQMNHAMGVVNKERGEAEGPLQVAAAVDEAALLFPDNAVGDHMHKALRTYRSAGVDTETESGWRFALGTQRPFGPEVDTNTAVKIILRTAGAFQREVAVAAALKEKQEARLPILRPGMAYGTQPGLENGANRVRLTNSSELPKGKGVVVPPLEYIQTGPAYEGPITQAVHASADVFLHDRPGGNMLDNWARSMIVAQVEMLDVVGPADKLRASLTRLRADKGDAVLRATVSQAITEAADKLGVYFTFTPDSVIQALLPDMREMAQGAPRREKDPSELRFDLAFDRARFAPLERALNAQMDKKDPQALGVVSQVLRKHITGEKVSQQIAAIDTITSNAFWEAHGALSKRLNSLRNDAPALADADVVALCGHSLPGRNIGEQSKAFDSLQDEVTTDPTKLSATVWENLGGEQENVGVALKELREQLVAHLDKQRAAAPRLSSKWDDAYRADFPDGIPGKTAAEEVEYVKAAKVAFLAQSAQEAPNSGHLIFGRTASGRMQIETNVARWVTDNGTDIYPGQDAALTSLDVMIGENKGEEWIAAAAALHKTLVMAPDTNRLFEETYSAGFEERVESFKRRQLTNA